MSADIQRFPEDPPRRPRPAPSSAQCPSSAAPADRNLAKVFAFVQRWATRSRIDDKLTRLEAISPDSFQSLAPWIEEMVDAALAAVPESARQSSRRATSMTRLTWVLLALAIAIGLIAFGQQLAATFRTR
jgi:hypothetical protein